MDDATAKAALDLMSEYVREQDRIDLAYGFSGKADTAALDDIAHRFATLLSR
jgi:hypothetical protein